MHPQYSACWCGAPPLKGRACCSLEHGRMATGKRKRRKDRRCYCGKPALPKRACCSDACANTPRNKGRRKAHPCRRCGTLVHDDRTYCSDDCLLEARNARKTAPARGACAHCGSPTEGKRKTCSRACFRALYSTSEHRRKRNSHKNCAYKKADRAAVIAALTASQDGRCLVCKGEGERLGNGNSGLVLDHCHVTGQPRAMLCGRCNAALGLMREDPSAIESLRVYAVVCTELRTP